MVTSIKLKLKFNIIKIINFKNTACKTGCIFNLKDSKNGYGIYCKLGICVELLNLMEYNL